MEALNSEFFTRNTPALAKALLGCYLTSSYESGFTVGRIVETEAYLSKNDPACHAARGQTKRNAIMFGPPGYAYVYFIYGMYDLFNVVSGKPGLGEAVLIRALEPIDGIGLMKQRRNTESLRNLTNGPAKLVQAMGISRDDNGVCLRSSHIKLLGRDSFRKQNLGQIVTSTRIGISAGQDLKLRFFLKESDHISKL